MPATSPDLTARKGRQARSRLVRSRQTSKAKIDTAPDYEQMLTEALADSLKNSSYPQMWDKLKEHGATDEQIIDSLNTEWGEGTQGAEPTPWEAQAGKCPAIWLSGTDESEAPKLSGKDLISKVRDILHIFEPDGLEFKILKHLKNTSENLPAVALATELQTPTPEIHTALRNLESAGLVAEVASGWYAWDDQLPNGFKVGDKVIRTDGYYKGQIHTIEKIKGENARMVNGGWLHMEMFSSVEKVPLSKETETGFEVGAPVEDSIPVEVSDSMPDQPPSLEFHPLANIFPFMSKEDFDGLVEDMKANGYREDKPIWLYEGRILEGRNRAQAALQAGVTPTFTQYEGDDPVTFVLQENLHRRHLTSSQKAVIALELEKVFAEKAKKRQGTRTDLQDNIPQLIAECCNKTEEKEARSQAAKALGTNRQYVSDAKKLREEAPELLEKVKAGKLTISKAKKQLKKRQVESPSQTVLAVGDVVQITFPPELRDLEEVQLFNHQVGTIVEITTNGIGFIVEVDGKRTPPIPKHSLSPATLPEPDPDKLAQVHTLAVSAKTNEHYTPAHILSAVYGCLGELDLDPCSDATHNVEAKHHFTIDDQGLEQEWRGKVFMNPPFSESALWVEKLVDDYESGKVESAIALTENDNRVSWYARAMEGATAFCLVQGYTKFIGSDDNSSAFGVVLWYFGDDVASFYNAFHGVIGWVCQPLAKGVHFDADRETKHG